MPSTLSRNPSMDLPVPLSVGLMQPLGWLVLGWKDMCRAPALSLAHGL